MNRLGKILVVEDEPKTLRALQRLLLREGSWKVEVALEANAGLALARTFRPDIIVSDYEMPGMDGFEFCQQVKANPNIASALFIMLTAYTDTPLKVKGLRLGVDDYITKPIEASELLAKVDAHLRIKRLHDGLREDRGRLEVEQGQLHMGFEQLLSVLLYVLDLRIPGAEARGDRLAQFSLKIGERFGIPDRYMEDLKLAALLLEIGRIIEQPDDVHLNTANPLSMTPGDWIYAVSSQAVLQRVDYLEEAAEIVGVVYENWDGTGLPHRWRQGQIPLRSRIIRTLVDFFAILGDDRCDITCEEVDEAVAKLYGRSGTWYDPMVLEHLSAAVCEDPRACLLPAKYRVPIGGLKEGMVLAKDLCTMGGIKLLAAGARLTSRTLEIIRQRHLSDPIIEGAWVAK